MTDNTNLFKPIDQDMDMQLDPNKDYVEELVGDGKKFKTVSDLAKGKKESDLYIAQLQTELAGLRGELQGKLSLEEFMDRLEKRDSDSKKVITPGLQPPAESHKESIPLTGLTKEQVEEILAQREKEATEKANLRFVAERLREQYGEQFQQVVSEKAKELDIGQNYLESIAKERPNAFLKLMGLAASQQKLPEKKEVGSFLPKDSVNSQAMPKGNSQMKKFSDFEKLRKTDYRTYISPSVQNEMFRLTKEYGDEFLKS